MPHAVTNWNVLQKPVEDAFWGNVTASIDWCEANYDVSRYICEFVNTLSNIPFLFYASFGIRNTLRHDLPRSLALPFVGSLMIGVGSLLFHMTLSYRMQLLDELPMLWAVTTMAYCVFDTQKSGERPPVPQIGKILMTMTTSVCAAYLVYPDPVLHQVAFASILLLVVARSTYLCHHHLLNGPFEQERNREVVRNQWAGILIVIASFIIWLVDCFACSWLTRAKAHVGRPAAFLFELHAWWHLGTGLGGYWLTVALQLLIVSIKEEPKDFTLKHTSIGGLPYVARTRQKAVNGHARKHD